MSEYDYAGPIVMDSGFYLTFAVVMTILALASGYFKSEKKLRDKENEIAMLDRRIAYLEERLIEENIGFIRAQFV